MVGDKEVVMSIRHQSTVVSDQDVVSDQVSAPDIMGSRETKFAVVSTPTGTRVIESDVVVSRPSSGLMFASFLAILLSAWAGIVPYVGPTFGFSADGSSSWTWNNAHTYGALVPGAVGVIFAMLVLAAARRPVGVQSAGTLASAGFIVFLCGAWLTVVPVVWPVISSAYFHVASPSTTLEYWLGYASGPGILLAAFGAYVMGRSRGAAAASRVTGA
jgi:hypothetical protein